ncbi:NADPH-dependent ferric siderophore reductase, contains FAD-binding and SIP domains [Jatrophihabitans endophyticus]|uniref:NADPH-dependent ferric siderophore reductase, contains FAD-binding and SIP domains n=1 Tax=Jatrophihabitans endophyticus TaxID=1206085 RepID=A0A1M5DZW1_9ACTN|nr:siderophore-interacting protein [Jatrophihabitans endophyticus]SHF72446.1 NADPH-dependent ferric siderophore reductase, contains FAD-binding and SIP domains [Jatrophihabitans endophyticus]
MKRRLLDRLLHSARVHSVQRRAARWRHVTLVGPELAELSWQPGQHVRLQVAAAPGAVDWLVGTLRTYSVWDHHDDALELLVFDHGDGPGAAWARTARPGDELRLLGPEGRFVTAPAAHHLFVGEETAQVAYGPMLRALPADAVVFGRLEVDGPDERLDLGADGIPRHDVEWSYRGGRSAASAQPLVDAVRALDLPPEPGIAYLAGEAHTIQLVRRHLVEERQWPRRNVRTKPFWTPGRTGLD